MDDPADPARAARLPHRLRALPHHRADATTWTSGPARRSSATWASSGTSRLASAEELDELAAWIRLFKEHRGLLFSGDIIRLDFPDETLTAGGVVAADQRTALYYLVATGRSEVVSLGRIRLPGLAAEPAVPGHAADARLPAEWTAPPAVVGGPPRRRRTNTNLCTAGCPTGGWPIR